MIMAVYETLDWIEKELLETRGWDPETRKRPRIAGQGMAVAGFQHMTSRDLDPQLHTHCILANMTRIGSGAWRSVEPTLIRRNAKLIGAYYRNELASRLVGMGFAVAPRLIGRVPGFELAGYSQDFLDAFSGRRREILRFLKETEPSLYGGGDADGGAAHAQAQDGGGPCRVGARMAGAGRKPRAAMRTGGASPAASNRPTDRQGSSDTKSGARETFQK